VCAGLITLEYKTKGAKEAEAGARGVTNAVEDLTAKLKKADFTPFDSLAKKLQRAEFGGGASGATGGMAAARKEMSLTAFEATQLSYQLNDVFVSLAGGQKPLMVLIQQGSQITGLFGGIGATFMRLDEWTFRGVTLLFPIVLGIAGWALTLETRISEIVTQLAERGPRLAAIETLVSQLHDAIHDPSPKPETKVEIAALKAEHERLDERVTRLEERLNALHNYILALPVRPGPYAPPGPSRRGDLGLELPFDKGMN
jgi:hypothetical protein